MSTPTSVPAPGPQTNAYLGLSHCYPVGANYSTVGSSYQSLVKYNVYKELNQINISFFNAVPVGSDTTPTSSNASSSSSFTIQKGNWNEYYPDAATVASQEHYHPVSTPNGPTIHETMVKVISDARSQNSDMLVFATLAWNKNFIIQILANDASASGTSGVSQDQQETNANNFAQNLITYLTTFQMNGFDVDWESGANCDISELEFKTFVTAIGSAFQTNNSNNPDSPLWFTLTPAANFGSPNPAGNMDADTVNTYIDWMNLQTYGGATPSTYTGININNDVTAAGVKMIQYACELTKNDTASVFNTYENTGYNNVIQYTISSDVFPFTQASMIVLSQMIKGVGSTFDDSTTMELAQYPPITSMKVYYGNVLDGVQPTNTVTTVKPNKTLKNPIVLPLHGGSSGTEATITLGSGEYITSCSGHVGFWYETHCVVQIQFETNKGNTFGPYGSMNNTTGTSAFSHPAQANKMIYAFQGHTANVTLADGTTTDILAGITPFFSDTP